MKNNLLIYIEFTSFGGAEQYVLYLIEALRINHNIFLACSGSDSYAEYFEKNKYLKKIFYNPIQFQPINKNNLYIQNIKAFSIWIDNIIDEISPDTFIANNGGYPWNMSCIIAIERSFKKGIRNRILIPHSTPDNVHCVNGMNIDNIVTESASAIIFGSHKLMELYQLRKDLDPSLFKVCHYGVPDIGTCNGKYRNAEKNINVGFLGSMRNLRKGQMQILKTANITKSQNITYLFAGNGENLHELESYANRKNLDNVRFLGHLDGQDKRSFFSEVDIFILVSEQEGLSLALLEALSSGCSIIATNVGGISEAVYDGVNGFLLNEVSDKIIADLISKLQYSPLLLNEFCNNSRKIYKNLFDYQIFKKRLNETFDDLKKIKTKGQSFYSPFTPPTNIHSLNHGKALHFFKNDALPILIGKTLEIEISSKCQHSCFICPRNKIEKSRGFGNMDRHTFNYILNKFIDQHIECIYVCGIGEPTMHPEWVNICQELKIKSNCKLILCSNGVNLPSLNDLRISKIDRLEVSLHHFDIIAKHSDKYFNNAIDAIRKIYQLNRELIDNNINVEVSLGIVKHNFSKNYIESLADYATANGLEIINWNLWNRAGNINDKRLRKHKHCIVNLTPFMCSEYGESIFIDWRGDILSCCCDAKSQNIDGSVLSDTIESIRLQKAHKLSLRKPLFSSCKVCDSPKTNQLFQETDYFKIYLEVMS